MKKNKSWSDMIFSNLYLLLGVLVFTVSCEQGNNIDENQYEPNDSEEEATEIGIYDSITGYIGENDVDFFEFNTRRNYIDFTRVNVYNLESTNELETRVFDQYMNELSKLIGQPGDNMQIKFANAGGSYFIKVKSFNDQEGEYALSIDELDANDNHEPDNTLAEGQVIDFFPVNDQIGTILTDADFKMIDYECYKVLVRAGKRVDFDIIPSSSEITLHLITYNQDQQVMDEVNPGQGESITSLYFYNPETTDVYLYLKLDGTVPDNGGDYRISFSESNYTGKGHSAGIAKLE